MLHNFGNGTDGASPYAGLIFDAAGNLYGTTSRGRHWVRRHAGTVFELTPNGSGGWTETVLHSFCGAQRHGRGTPLRRPDLRCRRQSLRHDRSGRHLRRRDGVRVDARRRRELDGEGAVQLQRHGRGCSLRRPDLRCRRQSLRHDHYGGTDSAGTVFELSPGERRAGRRRCCTTSAPTVPTGPTPWAA